MKLGISSFAFGWACGVPGSEPSHIMDENDLLDFAQAHDLRLVQIGNNLPLIEFDAARIQRLAERAAREGIEVEIGGQHLTHENLVAYGKLARTLHAPILRFVIDAPGYHPAPEDVVQIIRGALPYLEGTTLGIENHDRFPARGLRDMIEAVGSERVGVCLDTANSLGANEGIREVAEVLGPYTVNLHIKDFTVERLPYLMGFTVLGRPAGSGMLDVPELLQQLQPHGRCRSAILELWTPPEEDIEDTVKKEALWAGDSVQYLKQFAWSD